MPIASGLSKYSIQLKDALTGEAIISSGGMAVICTNGSADKASLKDSSGAAASNPVAITNGRIEFYVASTVNKVDIYGVAPSGHGFVIKDVKPSGNNEYAIDKNSRQTTLVVPFSYVDQAGDATETNTGVDLPDGLVDPLRSGLQVSAIDAAETIDVGLLSGGTGGDADGLMDGASLAVLGPVGLSLANGAVTMGLLMREQDSANAGDQVPKAYPAGAGSNTTRLTYTLSTGTDTGKGFIHLGMTLLNVA